MSQGAGYIINKDSAVSIGIIFTFVSFISASVWTFAVGFTRIGVLEERVEKQESYIVDVATIKEQIKQMSTVLDEVRTDVKSIKN
jgi:hypothetical protein